MKKIIILGDSLGLPRPELSFEKTYPYLLQEKVLNKYHMISKHKRANDTKWQVNALYDDVELYKPDVVVIHLGVVDCAPRLFYRKEKILFHYINKVIPIVEFMSKYRFFLTKKLPKVYVNTVNYKINMTKIIDYLEERDIQIIVVGISKTSMENRKKSYGYNENILKYNNILEEILVDKKEIKFVDMYQYGEDVLLEDGHHLNEQGSLLLANELFKQIKDIE